MTTATMSRTDALAKIRELEQEAVTLETQFNENMDAIMKKIADAASLTASDDEPAPRRAAVANKPVASAKPAPKHKAVTQKPAGKVAPSERNYNNTMSLKEAIWDVLDRNPKEWSKLLPELPDEAEGLQIAEIKEIIESEKKWVSSSDNISTQLSSQLFNLKKENLIARGENARYYIVDGAELPSSKRGRKPAAE
jgi:hypothetical protein